MNIFKNNIQSLQRHRPMLAERILSLQPDSARYQFLQTQTSLPSLALLDASGKTILWHSRYDPLKEAGRELSTLDHSQIYVPVLLGIGLGYTLRLLWERHRQEFYNAVIIERDPRIFRSALQVTDLSDLFADQRMQFFIGDHWGEFQGIIHNAIPGIMSSRIQWLRHTPSLKWYSDYYQTAQQELVQKIRIAEAEFNLMLRSGRQIQENLWRNLPAIIRSPGIRQLQGMWQEKPAIVVAAGPSLDNNVGQLQAVQNQSVIIAVDTAYKTLLQHEIHPHFVVTTDPTELNRKHFENIEPSSDTILVFDPEVYYTNTQNWRFRQVFINLDKSAFTRWIEHSLGPYGCQMKGGSVGHTAYFVARDLGADPIIFIGLDLAFNPEGGATHASASALRREHAEIPIGQSQAVLGPRFQSDSLQENIVWVPGIVHELVPTSSIMAIYIRQFQESFSQCPQRIIDATEGGARIPGTEVMPLQQALRKVISRQVDCRKVLESIQQPRKRPDAQIRQDLQEILQSLHQAPTLAERGIQLTHSLLASIDQAAALRESAEWQEMENLFSQLHQSPELTIALEQALFSAVYQFVKKEFPDQVELRLQKYQVYFQEVLRLSHEFYEIMKMVYDDLTVEMEP
ncbi:MAG: motility associated factor glycosyltransferase family protein [bacterium]